MAWEKLGNFSLPQFLNLVSVGKKIATSQKALNDQYAQDLDQCLAHSHVFTYINITTEHLHKK